MKLRWYNRNAVGTHFGGSLYSMVDPWYMLLLMRVLGRDYMVWDQAASIRFLNPGRGRVRSEIRIDDAMLDEIRHRTEGGDAYRPEFELDILDDEGDTVASVTKVVYVRQKPAARVSRSAVSQRHA